MSGYSSESLQLFFGEALDISGAVVRLSMCRRLRSCTCFGSCQDDNPAVKSVGDFRRRRITGRNRPDELESKTVMEHNTMVEDDLIK